MTDQNHKDMPKINAEIFYEKDPIKAHEKAFKENFGQFLVVGCAYYRGHLWYITLNFSISIGSFLLMAYTSYMIYGDFGTFSECLHSMVLIANGACTSLWYIINKKCFDNIYRIVGSGFFDYGASFCSKTFNYTVEKMRISAKIYKRKYCWIFIIVIGSVGFINTFIRPLYDWLSGKYDNEVNTSDGIIRTVPLAMWFPFDPNSKIHLIVGIIYQYYACFVVTIFIICLEIPLITVTEELCSEFQLLAKGVELFDERAKSLYKILYGDNVRSENMDKWKIDRCIRLCLRDTVRHHEILISCFKDLDRINFVPLLTGILAATLLLCFSGILFTDKSVSLSVKIVFLSFMSSESVYTFFFCWYGQRIQDASCLINEAVYNSNWMQHSNVFKKYALIINSCSKKPLKLRAGGFIEITLPTFSDIYRSAYSYFSLLQAMNE